MPKASDPEPAPHDRQRLDEVFHSRMDRLRMRHLRLLDGVARSGSLSGAADAIGMSQPGATKMLQELEHAFGCKLIERSAKGGELTTAGAHVLGRLRIALHAIDRAHAAVDAHKELPLVRLGIIPLVGIHALGHVVGAMHADRSLPRLQIELGTVESLLRDLSEGRVDAVVGFLDDASVLRDIARLTVRALWDEHLVIVAANDHPLAARKKVSLAMARDADWVLMPPASSTRRALERMFLHAGLTPPEPCIETASFHIGLALVADSQLLAAVPASACQQRSSAVRILPMEVDFPATTMVFATLAEVPVLPAVELIARRFQDYTRSL